MVEVNIYTDGVLLVVDGLLTPIKIIVPFVDHPRSPASSEVTCVYYDRDLGVWSANGLRVAELRASDVVCETFHLTEFTLQRAQKELVMAVECSNIHIIDKASLSEIWNGRIVPPAWYFCIVILGTNRSVRLTYGAQGRDDPRNNAEHRRKLEAAQGRADARWQ